MYRIKILRISRGQSYEDLAPYEVANSTRKKEARGLTKMHRNSTGDMLLEKYNSNYAFNYYEYDDYYIFLIEDLDGIAHEAHVFLVED